MMTIADTIEIDRWWLSNVDWRPILSFIAALDDSVCFIAASLVIRLADRGNSRILLNSELMGAWKGFSNQTSVLSTKCMTSSCTVPCWRLMSVKIVRCCPRKSCLHSDLWMPYIETSTWICKAQKSNVTDWWRVGNASTDPATAWLTSVLKYWGWNHENFW